MGFKTNRQVACEILSSSVCNADCTYCFIPKVKSLKEFLPRIKSKIDTRKYIEELKSLYGNQLECLSLWGTEPLTTISDWSVIMPDVISEFPKLNKISFSTNMFIDSKKIIEFISYLPKDRDNFYFEIQVSIDGPPEITDNNRGKGATKKIVHNFKNLICSLNNIDLGKTKIKFGFKPTIGTDNIDWFLESSSRLYGYFFFFDNLIDSLVFINKNKNVRLALGGVPTLVVPGFYTTQDGLKFSKFLDMLYSIESENNTRNIFKHLKGKFNLYEIRFDRFFDFCNEYDTKPSMFTCSGGDSNFQLDCDGKVHICHRTLFYESKEYIDSLVKTDLIHGREESLSKGMIDNMSKNWIVKYDDQKELNRFVYIIGNYHNNNYFNIHASLGLVFELAKTGQISKVFLDKNAAIMFINFVNVISSCSAENLLNNGTVYIPPISMFRMFGNGFFEKTYIKMMSRGKAV